MNKDAGRIQIFHEGPAAIALAEAYKFSEAPAAFGAGSSWGSGAASGMDMLSAGLDLLSGALGARPDQADEGRRFFLNMNIKNDAPVILVPLRIRTPDKHYVKEGAGVIFPGEVKKITILAFDENIGKTGLVFLDFNVIGVSSATFPFEPEDVPAQASLSLEIDFSTDQSVQILSINYDGGSADASQGDDIDAKDLTLFAKLSSAAKSGPEFGICASTVHLDRAEGRTLEFPLIITPYGQSDRLQTRSAFADRSDASISSRNDEVPENIEVPVSIVDFTARAWKFYAWKNRSENSARLVGSLIVSGLSLVSSCLGIFNSARAREAKEDIPATLLIIRNLTRYPSTIACVDRTLNSDMRVKAPRVGSLKTILPGEEIDLTLSSEDQGSGRYDNQFMIQLAVYRSDSDGTDLPELINIFLEPQEIGEHYLEAGISRIKIAREDGSEVGRVEATSIHDTINQAFDLGMNSVFSTYITYKNSPKIHIAIA